MHARTRIRVARTNEMGGGAQIHVITTTKMRITDQKEHSRGSHLYVSLEPRLSVLDFVSQLWRKAARQNQERMAWFCDWDQN